jgi:hypothetical protein
MSSRWSGLQESQGSSQQPLCWLLRTGGKEVEEHCMWNYVTNKWGKKFSNSAEDAICDVVSG